MIKCIGCKEDKEDVLFPWRNQLKGIRQQYCKSCKSKYNKTWYANNKEKHLSDVENNNKKTRLKNLKIIRDIKNVPCTDCNIKYPYYVMDFDHLEEFEKHFDIASMSLYSEKKIIEEISKCEVICSNCHRERTHKRRLS